MTIVQHKLTYDDGVTPIVGSECRVDLPNTAISRTTLAQLSESVWSKSDENGVLTFDLLPNSMINPDGTFYTFFQPYNPGKNRLMFQVPDRVGPYNMADILVGTLPEPSPIQVGVTNSAFEAEAAALSAAIAGIAAGQGQPRYYGQGQPPVSIVGARPDDLYLDVSSGDIYRLS